MFYFFMFILCLVAFIAMASDDVAREILGTMAMGALVIFFFVKTLDKVV